MVINTGTIITAVVYRPPTGNMPSFLGLSENMLAYLGSLVLASVMMGDVNGR